MVEKGEDSLSVSSYRRRVLPRVHATLLRLPNGEGAVGLRGPRADYAIALWQTFKDRLEGVTKGRESSVWVRFACWIWG